MRAALTCALVFAAGVAASAAEAPARDFGEWAEPASFVEVAEVPVPGAVGYIPVSSAFDNAGTTGKFVPTIPSNPDCTVRPQTVVEIKRMRRSAARIAQMITTEVVIMEKRKTYVEQMTAYLNDRIRELNKVKGELDQEYKWVEVSNQRIAELAQKEKLIKMQDILSCLNEDSANLQGKKNTQAQEISAMQTQAAKLERNILEIKNNIRSVNAGSGSANREQQHGGMDMTGVVGEKF